MKSKPEVITEEWYNSSCESFPYIISHKDGYKFVDENEDVTGEADALCSPGNDVHIIYYDNRRLDENSDRLEIRTISCTVENIADPVKERLLSQFKVPYPLWVNDACSRDGTAAINAVYGYFMALGLEAQFTSNCIEQEVLACEAEAHLSNKPVRYIDLYYGQNVTKDPKPVKGNYIIRSKRVGNELMISISIIE